MVTDKEVSQPFADAAFDFEGLRHALQSLHVHRTPDVLFRCVAQAAAQHARAQRAVVFVHEVAKLVARGDSCTGDNGKAKALAAEVLRSVAVEMRRMPGQTLMVGMPLTMEGAVRGALVIEGLPDPSEEFKAQALWGLRLLADQTVIALDIQGVRNDLRALQDTMLAVDRDSYHLQIAGGFAHEMRNALAPASLMMQTLVGGADVDEEEALNLQDERDVGALHALLSQEHVDRDAIAQALALVTGLQERRALTATALTIVGQALGRGLRVSSQVVDFAQVGHLKPGDDTVSIASVVTGVIDEYREKLDANAISAHVSVEGDLTVAVKEAHIYAIVRNLVHNACDALGVAGVKDRQLRVEAMRDANGIVLQVHDTGPGIPEDVRKRMFEPFFSTKGAKGTGLGLGLSRRLAQAYGGNLDLRRDGAPGTTFWLRIPQSG